MLCRKKREYRHPVKWTESRAYIIVQWIKSTVRLVNRYPHVSSYEDGSHGISQPLPSGFMLHHVQLQVVRDELPFDSDPDEW